MGTKYMRKRLRYGISLLLLSLLVTGCAGGKTLSDDMQTELLQKTGKDVVSGFHAGLEDTSSYFCVQDDGFLFAKDSCLQYYDLQAEESFVLCSDVNCKHNDSACAAWYDYTEEIYGAAFYSGKVFYFQENPERNTIDLMENDLSGTSKKTLYSLKKGEYGVDDVLLTSLNDVYYANHTVYFLASYVYVVDTKESFEIDFEVPQAISLENPNLIELQSIPDPEELMTRSLTYHLDCISDTKLIYFSEQYQLKKIAKEWFDAQYSDGTFEGKSYQSDCPYEEYWLDRSAEESEKENVYYVYDMLSGKTQEIAAVDAITLEAEDGSVLGWMGGLKFYDQYQDAQFLCMRRNKEMVNRQNFTNFESDCFLWDFDTNQETPLALGEIGGIVGCESFLNGGVLDENRFRYVVYAEDGETLELYAYDLETHASEKVLEDQKNITFRIVDTADAYFIGKIYEVSSWNTSFKLYQIQKEDYYAGKLDAKQRITY